MQHPQNAAQTVDTQVGRAQVCEIKRKGPGKSRRISQLAPEVRARVPEWFDTMRAEDIAVSLNIPPMQILEEALRHTRQALGLGPVRRLSIVRRAA